MVEIKFPASVVTDLEGNYLLNLGDILLIPIDASTEADAIKTAGKMMDKLRQYIAQCLEASEGETEDGDSFALMTEKDNALDYPMPQPFNRSAKLH